jgi:hypothetical protein
MLSVLKTLSSAGSKIIATFFMVLILIMLSVLFFPQGFNRVSDAANHLANLEIARNPPVSERGKTLVRLFINEASIFGILITLIARMVVEILILLWMFLWRLVNPPAGPDNESQPVRPGAFYGRN